MTQPFIGLCLIYRDNVDTLPLLLESISGCFDDYTFTDTGSTDGSRALVDAFLEKHPGRVNEFEWCDDFAAARNACFDASPARFKMFLDSDDVLENGKAIRPFLIDMEAKNAPVEAYFVPYFYDKLETLSTMRLVRWRDGWKWNDAIHERLEFHYPDGETLPEQAFFHVTTEFGVRHKPKTAEEKARAIARNARIAEREYAKTTDVKYRARLARTIAMELKAQGKAAETFPYLEELYREYSGYPEGRQAAADMHRGKMLLGELARAAGRADDGLGLQFESLSWAKKAGPAYEAISHHTLGMAYKAAGLTTESRTAFQACIKACQRSHGRAGAPQTTHEGYTYERAAVYLAAASAVLDLGLPRKFDVAEALVNHIPADLRNAEVLAEWIAPIRGAVDRITILVPGTPQPFDEKGGGGMLGGSEEAVMYLTRALAEQGRNVRVYGVLPPHRLPGPDNCGVDWQPVQEYKPEIHETGTLVVWRGAGVIANLAQEAARTKKPFPGILQAFLWLHDSGLGVSKEVAGQLGQMCNGAVLLSDFHAKMVAQNGYRGPMFKLSNGIVEDDFVDYIEDPSFGFDTDTPLGYRRDQFQVVYSSCPSRGLVPLLKMWPEVKAAVPEARLEIYYDWSMIQAHQPGKYAEVMAAMEAVKDMDVKHHGGVDHPTLHTALRRANVWAYSHFESPLVETFCISAVKAQAAGATVLTVPNGALEEVTAGDAYFARSPEVYRDQLIELLKNPDSVEIRRHNARRAVARFGWRNVARNFSRLWSVRGSLEERLKRP